jgi:adenosylcobinamide-phosphate synthase
MRLEYQIIIAVLLDLVFGDPRWFPHPVRLIGRLITALEGPARRAIPDARAAGAAAALTVILAAVLATAAILEIAQRVHPWLGTAVSVLLIYTTLAARDLARHSLDVYRALANFDLARARRLVAWMVGRDTERLTETEVVRAAVESVAENTVDGIIAPLFFAALGGPVAAMAYKAVNTLDSMIGYRNERYIDFGRTAARIDDGANFLPARLSVPILTAAAAILGFRATAAWRIAWRDGRRNLSPNAGLSEAAVAGALGVRLGGVMERRGRPVNQPELGDPLVPLVRVHILAANRLMFLATVLAAALFAAARWGFASLAAMV